MRRGVALFAAWLCMAGLVSLEAARTGAAGPGLGTPAAVPAALQAAPAAPAGRAGASAVEWQRAFIDQYCVACHNDRTEMAGLSLQTVALDRVGHVAGEVGVWEKVIRKLRAQSMPPAGRRRPEPAGYDRVASWLEGAIDEVAAGAPNPGRPVIHRLNRAEYANAIRDLLALDVDGRDRPCCRPTTPVTACCRPTTPVTASTTLATCSHCPPACSTAT